MKLFQNEMEIFVNNKACLRISFVFALNRVKVKHLIVVNVPRNEKWKKKKDQQHLQFPWLSLYSTFGDITFSRCHFCYTIFQLNLIEWDAFVLSNKKWSKDSRWLIYRIMCVRCSSVRWKYVCDAIGNACDSRIATDSGLAFGHSWFITYIEPEAFGLRSALSNCICNK